MSDEEVTPAGKGKKVVPKPKKWAKAADVLFDVGSFIETESMLDWNTLAIDYKKEFGQIRELDPLHWQALAKDFLTNPPYVLELTVWQHPGLF